MGCAKCPAQHMVASVACEGCKGPPGMQQVNLKALLQGGVWTTSGPRDAGVQAGVLLPGIHSCLFWVGPLPAGHGPSPSP